MKHIFLLAIAIIALATGVAACGGDDDGSVEPAAPSEPAAPAEEPANAGSGSNVVALIALEDGSLAYDTTELEVQCGGGTDNFGDVGCSNPEEEGGEVTIAFTNPSATPHNVAVEGVGVNASPLFEKVEGEVVTMADAPITFKPRAGTYTFFCSVPGHREAGMEGTLTVS